MIFRLLTKQLFISPRVQINAPKCEKYVSSAGNSKPVPPYVLHLLDLSLLALHIFSTMINLGFNVQEIQNCEKSEEVLKKICKTFFHYSRVQKRSRDLQIRKLGLVQVHK